MKFGIKFSLSVIFFIILCLLLSACKIYTENTKSSTLNTINTIGELAEVSKNENDNLIYIMEYKKYEPYIILAYNYNDLVLVWRKNLSEEKIQYNKESIFGTGGNYYAESNIDEYLNNEYIERYSTGFRQNISETKISIADKETINRGDYRRSTEVIERKVFLLSAEEVGIRNSYLAKEGSQLSWFRDESRLYSSYPQWLRSAYLWDDTHAWILDKEYNYSENITEKLNFKPALALSRDLRINKVKQDNGDIYILEADKNISINS